jgi:predicted transcriptional regulator
MISTYDLSKALNAYMNENRVTVHQIAQDTGLHRPTVHKILKGQEYDPRLSTVNTIINYLRSKGILIKIEI